MPGVRGVTGVTGVRGAVAEEDAGVLPKPSGTAAEPGDRNEFLSSRCSERSSVGRPSWETIRGKVGWRVLLVAYIRGVPSGQYIAPLQPVPVTAASCTHR